MHGMNLSTLRSNVYSLYVHHSEIECYLLRKNSIIYLNHKHDKQKLQSSSNLPVTSLRKRKGVIKSVSRILNLFNHRRISQLYLGQIAVWNRINLKSEN